MGIRLTKSADSQNLPEPEKNAPRRSIPPAVRSPHKTPPKRLTALQAFPWEEVPFEKLLIDLRAGRYRYNPEVATPAPLAGCTCPDADGTVPRTPSWIISPADAEIFFSEITSFGQLLPFLQSGAVKPYPHRIAQMVDVESDSEPDIGRLDDKEHYLALMERLADKIERAAEERLRRGTADAAAASASVRAAGAAVILPAGPDATTAAATEAASDATPAACTAASSTSGYMPGQKRMAIEAATNPEGRVETGRHNEDVETAPAAADATSSEAAGRKRKCPTCRQTFDAELCPHCHPESV